MKTMSQNGLIEFLNTQVAKGLLSKQDASDLADGKKQFQSEEVYIRKKLGNTSGILALINENDVEKPTVSNLSKGRIPDEKNIVAHLVGIRFGYSATDVAPELVDYSNAVFNMGDVDFDGGATATGDAVFARRIPTQLQNAVYTLKCDDVVIDNGRVEDLLSQNASVDGVNGHPKNFRELEYPKLLLSGKTLRCDIQFPDGGSVPAGYWYAELVVKGLGLGKRANA